MNHMKSIVFLSLAISLAFLSSCDKHDHDDHDHGHSKPEVSFLSPAALSVHNEGDTVWLRVVMKSEEDLHDYSIDVKNLKTGAIVYNYEGHSHKKELTTALYFIPEVTEDANMQLRVTNKDHDGNLLQQKSIDFTVKNVSNTIKPTIQLVTPTTGASFSNGSVMRIQGAFNHTSFLKEASIVVKKNGSVELNYIPVLNDVKSFTFDTTYRIQTIGHSDYDLILTVKDFDNNITTRTQSYHVH